MLENPAGTNWDFQILFQLDICTQIISAMKKKIYFLRPIVFPRSDSMFFIYWPFLSSFSKCPVWIPGLYQHEVLEKFVYYS